MRRIAVILLTMLICLSLTPSYGAKPPKSKNTKSTHRKYKHKCPKKKHIITKSSWYK